MSTTLLFWILMLAWLGLILRTALPSLSEPAKRPEAFAALILFVLLVLLGWERFGPAVHR
jgi:hypothetical protein